jgi:hypothetical protein
VSAFFPRLLVTAGAVALGLSAPATALADPGGDPAGNNGTIKIQPYGGAAGHANHPHPGCDFRLQLWGFDDDQTGTITFTGQAPTADAVTKQPLSGSRLLSDDAARGGQDDDAFFDVRGADLGLTGAPAKQGYHVKVRVDADDAPGGAKTKVFWLSCPAPAPTAATATEAGTTGTQTAPTSSGATSGTTAAEPSTGSTTLTTTSVQGATSGAALGGATVGLTTPEASTQGSESALTTFSGGSAAAVRDTSVGGGRTSAPGGAADALPFTGLPALALVGLGLGTLAAGTLAVRAGRRRTASSVEL